jgi:hypothetical protein
MISDKIKGNLPKKETFEKTFEAMEGFCFAITIAGLSGPSARKNDDNDNEVYKDKRWIASIRTVLKRKHCTSC